MYLVMGFVEDPRMGGRVAGVPPDGGGGSRRRGIGGVVNGREREEKGGK